MSSFGPRIRELRLERGLTQRALAEMVGVTFPHISKIELSAEHASSDLIGKLAKALDADADELFHLAERLPNEITDIVIGKADLASQFLRTWQAGGIKDSDVEGLLQKRRKR